LFAVVQARGTFALFSDTIERHHQNGQKDCDDGNNNQQLY